MQTLSFKKRKANKNHKCDFCGFEINKGEEYEFSSIKFEGIIYSWKNHLHCSILANKYHWFDDVDEGLTGDQFHDCVNEQYDHIMDKYFSDLYDSKEFQMPSKQEKIKFLLEFNPDKGGKEKEEL